MAHERRAKWQVRREKWQAALRKKKNSANLKFRLLPASHTQRKACIRKTVKILITLIQ